MYARLLLALAGTGITGGTDMAGLGWTNVLNYGAVGDGSHDDTSAITAAIAALPASGGVLYFPPGSYKTSGGFTLSTPCMVVGGGGGGGTTLDYGPGAIAVPYVSRITCTSATAVLFTVSCSGVGFFDLSLVCTATATAGAGIQTVAGGGDHAQYVGITVSGFYIGIDQQYGREWALERCWILDWVLSGVRHQNLDINDEGEASITGCYFISQRISTGAAYDILGGGGIRFVNCQFVGIPPMPYAIRANISGATSNLLISNCTMEGWSVNAVLVSGSATFYNIIIEGCQMQGGGTGYHEAIKVDNGSRVNIGQCTLVTTETGYDAINLTSVTHAVVVGNYWEGFDGFLGGSSQTDVNAASNYGA